jgi:hypothetical protein
VAAPPFATVARFPRISATDRADHIDGGFADPAPLGGPVQKLCETPIRAYPETDTPLVGAGFRDAAARSPEAPVSQAAIIVVAASASAKSADFIATSPRKNRPDIGPDGFGGGA